MYIIYVHVHEYIYSEQGWEANIGPKIKQTTSI